jgi:disulfide bond formation protein DsbB
MNKNIVRQLVNVLLVVATLVVNALANIIPFNGKNTGAISDQFHVYFVPAGYVFAIWGLIYVGLIAFGVYQALPSQRDNPRLRSVDGFFALASLANMVWLFLWHYEQFVATLAVMLVLLGSLIGIYLRLGTGRTQVSTAETWLVGLPFSIYLGWITVATIANVTEVLDYQKWKGFGLAPETWMLIVLGAVFVIATLMNLTRRDVAYTLVILWALIGIVVKQADVALVANATRWTAAAVAVTLAVSLFLPKQAEKTKKA